MKPSYNYKINKAIKSFDVTGTKRIKKILKKKNNYSKSAICSDFSVKKGIIRDLGHLNDKEEITILSNENLNIIKILNNCANNEILNDYSFLEKNNDSPNETSLESISKWSRRMNKFIPSPEIMHKKRKNLHKNSFNSNKSKFFLNPSDIGCQSDISNKGNNFIKSWKRKSIISKLKNNKNETTNDEKRKIKRKKMRFSCDNINTYNLNKINNIFRINNFNDNLKNPRSKISKNFSTIQDIEDKGKYKELLNEVEIMQINEHIHNDINFIQLKKKISNLKKSIQNKNTKNVFTKTRGYSLNKIETIRENIGQSFPSVVNHNSPNEEINREILKGKFSLSIKSKNQVHNPDKFRVLIRKKDIYDSFDDEEYKDEEIDYYISPDSWAIKIFDCILFLSSMIYFIILPYFLSINFFIKKDNKLWDIIFIVIDVVYILDVILNFFRAYHNFYENLISRNKLIFLHYLKTWFLLDFIQAIPFFSIIQFIEKFYEEQSKNPPFGHYIINQKLYILLIIKLIKIYKMFNQNSTIFYFSEILLRSEILDDHGGFIIVFFIIIFILNLTTCLFIFIGINSFPGWIIELNIQDESYLNIYLTSVYFVIVTITTVGYGDITGKTFLEIIFQICLLIIGTISYSFTISFISNYIIKSNQKSMTFEKNLEILQEIKFYHPNMKDSLYNEVLRNLYNEQIYEKKDKHLLFDCLPYSLKNKLIMEMYKPLINKFVFFKDIDNSDFIVKVITSLKPIISMKGDIIIQEGDFIKEIIFIKRGVISLNISIDLNEPEASLRKYFCNNKIGKLDLSYLRNCYIHQRKSIVDTSTTNFISSLKSENNLPTIYKNNQEFIKIIEIRNNEHFGDALMFLNEPCPLIAKVRTNSAELLILRKMDAIEIYSIYPNIWKRINKKSLFNMDQICLKIKKIVIQLSKRFGINIEHYLGKRKNINSMKKSAYKLMDDNIKQSKNDLNSKFNEKESCKEHKDNIQIQKDHPQKIIHFNENMNINDNISTNNSNNIENITFLKKNLTKRETILSLKVSKKNTEKNSLFRSITTNKKSMKNLNLDFDSSKPSNKELKIDNNHFSKKSLIKFNSVKSILSKARQNSMDAENHKNSLMNTSLFPNAYRSSLSRQINSLNNSNISSSQRDKKKFKTTYTKNEKILYNSFTNLSLIKEKSFHIKSSYDNINKMFNNKYIKNINLQNKIKEVIMNENIKANDMKNTFLKLPSQNLPRLNNEFENFINDRPYNSSNNNNKELFKKTLTHRILKSDNNNKDFEYSIDSNNKKSSSKKFCSFHQLLQVKKSEQLSSNRNIFERNKTPILDSRKYKKKNSKKKPEKIDIQLSIISKNIENTSKNINNPGEFYKNLFNNIIAKESRCFNDDEEEKNKNIKILDIHSKNKIKEGYISDKMNDDEKDRLDSFTSNKERVIKN